MIIVGITGSVAAYKSIELIKLLILNKMDFRVVLSKSAPDFISLLTLKSLFPGKVFKYDDLLDEKDEMLHIKLAKQASLILIAPASANFISKLVHGTADCLLSTICLASEAPIAIAPAMNKIMWVNDFTQSNIALFKKKGISNKRFLLGPASGLQACGDDGLGRMLEPEQIFEMLKYIHEPKILEGKRIIINAGPTQENIDPVRFISNHSSGKMGYELAKAAQALGAEVTLISGPSNEKAPYGVNLIKVINAAQMHKECLDNMRNDSIFIAAAAVSDFKVKNYQEQKIKKTGQDFILELENNIDILSDIRKNYPTSFIVGFAAETNNIIEYGKKKLHGKNLDLIAINDVSNNQVFSQNFNELNVIDKHNEHILIERAEKYKVALGLLKIIAEKIKS